MIDLEIALDYPTTTLVYSCVDQCHDKELCCS